MAQRSCTAILILAIMALALAGCRNSAGRSTPPDSTEVHLDSPSGTTSGLIYGGRSTRGVVLIVGDSNTDVWSALASELGQMGYRVLLLPQPLRDGGATARAAADRLAGQGVEQVVFIGSGRGAAAALEAAAGGSNGVGILNPDGSTGVIPAGGMPPVALLVMATLGDGPSSAAAQQLYRAAREPRTLALYPSSEAIPAAFAGDSNELKAAFFDFLRTAFQPLAA